LSPNQHTTSRSCCALKPRKWIKHTASSRQQLPFIYMCMGLCTYGRTGRVCSWYLRQQADKS